MSASRPGSGAMFDGIAARYDLLNRLISLGLDRGWRRALVEALAPAAPARVLDLATGTGDVALALARRFAGARVFGLDPSPRMLALAPAKVARAGVAARCRWLLGDAQRLPFPARSFDGVTIAFGIRNVPDRDAALAEMARVTRPGGVVAVLELSEPRRGLLAPLARLHVHRLVPGLGALLSGSREYAYLARSIAAFPAPEEFAARLEAAGLEAVAARPLTFGTVHLYTGRVPDPGS